MKAINRWLIHLGLILCFAGASRAQETRGTILGTVRDASGAAVAGAKVEAVNTETKAATTVTSNENGAFEIPYLVPGAYEVTATAQGFKRFLRQGIAVSVGSRVNLGVQFEVGELSEAVVVSAAGPILETTSGNGSATLGSLQIRNMPVFGNSALLVARSVPGIQWTGQPNYLGLHSNVGASAISAAGGVGGTEFTLDGVPNSGTGRRVGFLPNTDSVEEVKVDVANFDARNGHTSGATVSMITKSGTNDFHGVLSWLHWQQRFNATQSTTNAAYWGPIAAAEARGDAATAARLRSGERQTSGRSNSYSGSVGGPVWFPEDVFGPLAWDGREKLFFFFSYSGYREAKSEEANAVNRTVPTLKQRRGDFSDLLALGPQYQIYDPRTARLVGGRVVRDPFPGNIVPILNPLYKSYVDLYPVPNNVAGVVGADGTNNYLASGTPFNWNYTAYQNRIDFNLSGRQKMSGKWSWNDFLEDRGDWTYETARGLNSNGLVRRNLGISVDYVLALNSTTSLNFAVGYNRFIEGNQLNAVQLAGSPGDVGLPAYLDQKAGDFKRLPIVNPEGFAQISGGYPGFGRYSVGFTRGEVSKILGNHGVVIGYDLRMNYRSNDNPGNTSGNFTFNNTYVRRADNNPDNAPNLGLSWAAFALGFPSGVSVETNDSLYTTNPYYGFFVQDNWRVTPNLTLNLGIRFEYEGGFRERFDRGVPGFDPEAELPIAAASEAAYAAIADRVGLPASQFKVRGGSLYLGQDGQPGTVNQSNFTPLPRAGFAYQIDPKTVIRGGYGLFADTINVLNFGLDQFGYSRGTNAIITNNTGLTFVNPNVMSDPFPVREDGTRFNVPFGNALGTMARVGRGQTFVNYEWENSKQHRWRFGIQRELTKSLVLDIAYLGSYTVDLSMTSNNPGDNDISRPLSPLPEQYWTSGLVRRQDLADALNVNVPNPFNIANFRFLQTQNPTLYQDMSTNGFFTSANIQRQQLLRAFPHMNGVTRARVPLGRLKYHHLEASLQQRLSQGLTFFTSYTWASSQVKDFFENEFDTEPRYRQNTNSRPHHFMVNLVAELPFGKGRKYFADNRVAGGLLGGWTLSGVYHWQTGRTYDFGNHFFFGDLRDIRLDGDEQTNDRWFNWEFFPGAQRDFVANDRGAYEARIRRIVPEQYLPPGKTYATVVPNDFRPAGFHRRVFPSRINWLRGDDMSQLDVSIARRFRFTEQTGLEFKVDLINSLNKVLWDNPNTDVGAANFGRVTQQYNTPRWIQFQLRFVF